MAGRALAPLRTIAATTDRISDTNLHERLAMDGPRDELRLLADTIDRLLARLRAAGVQSLTQRELEIARRIVDRQTNR